MKYNVRLLLVLLLIVSVDGNTCDDQIRLHGRQHSSSIFCSSCSIPMDGQRSVPLIQFELPSLTRLTGIFIQSHNRTRQSNSAGSYFIDYRRTQDGPWHSYGQRRQRKLFIQRRRLPFNRGDIQNPTNTRTFLPSIIVRQIRLVLLTSSTPVCVKIEFYGCPSQNGLISMRLPQNSILKPDWKYDGIIFNSTARGGLGILNDEDAYQFLTWSPSSQSILLLFAFESIKQFQSIELDIKCFQSSLSCTFGINVGIYETISLSNTLWTNRFRSIKINPEHDDDDTTIITHLILSLSKIKGQFIILQINTNDGLALSEVTFKQRNDQANDDTIPSSVYIETSLRKLESLVITSMIDEMIINDKFSFVLILILITATMLILFMLVSCMSKQQWISNDQVIPSDHGQSLISSITTTTNDESSTQSDIQLELYADLEISGKVSPDDDVSRLEPIVNESAQATVRTLVSFRQPNLSTNDALSMMHSSHRQLTPFAFHDYGCNHSRLTEIDSNEIVVIQNLAAQTNRQCFYSQYGKTKLPVIMYERENCQENDNFFTLSTLSEFVDHPHLVRCLGYVQVSPERCFLVTEYSPRNLLEHCQTMTIESLPILMQFIHQIVSALVHLESLNIIVRDLTLPNCLLIDNSDEEWTVKLSDYANQDDRYASRYVEQLPIRWLPGGILSQDESWSLQTNTFMFGTLLFELLHLGARIPYNDLTDDQVRRLFIDIWSNSIQDSVEPSILFFSTHFPRPILCNDRLYALIERCLSWSSSDRPSFREISLCLNETTE